MINESLCERLHEIISSYFCSQKAIVKKCKQSVNTYLSNPKI